MIHIHLPRLWLSFMHKECRNDQNSILQRFLCWLFGCCPDEDKKG